MLQILVLVLLGGALAAAQERPSDTEIGQIQTYLTPEEARQQIYPEAAAFVKEMKALPPALKETQGRGLAEDSLEVHVACGPAGQFLGYGAVSEELGKYRPITFMVGIGPDFRVRQVVVLVYRESRGGEVRRARFLKQYQGKSARDPLRLNRDIVNISGATLSVRALNFGVKKVLAQVEALYGPAAPAKQE